MGTSILSASPLGFDVEFAFDRNTDPMADPNAGGFLAVGLGIDPASGLGGLSSIEDTSLGILFQQPNNGNAANGSIVLFNDQANGMNFDYLDPAAVHSVMLSIRPQAAGAYGAGDVIGFSLSVDGTSILSNGSFAMVDAMDQAVGKVLEALDRLELAENTIVVFTSDNGGLSTGDRGISPEQGWPTSNLPLRAGKGWLYEGGIRVPLIIKSPCCPAGATSKTVVTSTDFYPTLLALTGLPLRPQQHADGADISGALRGQQLDRGPVFWHYPHYGNQGGSPGAAVRAGDWKLIQWYGDRPLELYDLANDLGEQENLADRQTAIRNDLLRQLDAWRNSTSAQYPSRNEQFHSVGGG